MLKINQLKNYLKTTSPEDSILILGAPGIGKSEVVKQFATEEAKSLGLEFIDYKSALTETAKLNRELANYIKGDTMIAVSEEVYKKFLNLEIALAEKILQNPSKYYVFMDVRLTEYEPTDISGIPREFNGAMVYKPFLWSVVLTFCRGLLFLDELTNVQRPDQHSVAYKIALDHVIGFCRLNPNTRLIAAGNRPEHSGIARELPYPLTDRFEVVDVEPPSLEAWSRYMEENYGEKWDKRTLAYLYRFPDDFHNIPKEPETLTKGATPRSWTKLALRLPNTPKEFIKAKAFALLGPEVGSRFIAFINTSVPEPQEIIKDPTIFKRLSLDAKYMSIISIANYYVSKVKDVNVLKDFLEVLADEQHEFISLFLLSAKKKLSELVVFIKNNIPRLWNAIMEIVNYIVFPHNT